MIHLLMEFEFYLLDCSEAKALVCLASNRLSE